VKLDLGKEVRRRQTTNGAFRLTRRRGMCWGIREQLSWPVVAAFSRNGASGRRAAPMAARCRRRWRLCDKILRSRGHRRIFAKSYG
jgi:hypothetical protein